MASENTGGAVGGAIAALAALTSPAKLAFGAYILLVYADKLPRPSFFAFLAIVAIFFVAQVFHDDYARPLLNNLAGQQITPVERGQIHTFRLSSARRVAIVVMVIAVIMGVVLAVAYFVHRPASTRARAWDRARVTAKPVRAFVSSPATLAVQFRLRNNTPEDYRVQLRTAGDQTQAKWNVFESDFRGLSPVLASENAVDPSELFLPAGEEVALTVQAVFLLSEADPRDKILQETRSVQFHGFVIFDNANRLRIDLPFDENVVQSTTSRDVNGAAPPNSSLEPTPRRWLAQRPSR
jgi:hypothetical protein